MKLPLTGMAFPHCEAVSRRAASLGCSKDVRSPGPRATVIRAVFQQAWRCRIGGVLAGLVVLTGEVVPGVECPALRLDSGRVVALSHLDSRFDIGARVTVSGPGYAPSATCQQEVFVVQEAAPAPPR